LSEERFRIALKKALVIVSSQDLQLRYTWISSSAMVVDPESIIGRTDAELVPG